MAARSAGPRWDAFLSHASEDDALATRIRKRLAANGVSVWLDHHDLRRQGLLLAELQKVIEHSRHLVLLWSKASAASRYVTAEWNFAWNRERSIVACRVDRQALPLGLAGMLYCDFRTSFADGIGQLQAALGHARAPVPAAPEVRRIATPQRAAATITRQQEAILLALGQGDTTTAARLQARAGTVVDTALRRYPKDADILGLAGYHLKNAYLLKHWRAFQAGRSPADALLERAESRFWAALRCRPNDASALNGIGNILWLRGELDAAEFYIARSVERAHAEGFDYPDAEEDLRHLRQQRAARARLARLRASQAGLGTPNGLLQAPAGPKD
ncbi:MAG: toll/interleukin-1 receptor domain-containing protein [Rubrivivax sp.]